MGTRGRRFRRSLDEIVACILKVVLPRSVIGIFENVFPFEVTQVITYNDAKLFLGENRLSCTNGDETTYRAQF